MTIDRFGGNSFDTPDKAMEDAIRKHVAANDRPPLEGSEESRRRAGYTFFSAFSSVATLSLGAVGVATGASFYPALWGLTAFLGVVAVATGVRAATITVPVAAQRDGASQREQQQQSEGQQVSIEVGPQKESSHQPEAGKAKESRKPDLTGEKPPHSASNTILPNGFTHLTEEAQQKAVGAGDRSA